MSMEDCNSKRQSQELNETTKSSLKNSTFGFGPEIVLVQDTVYTIYIQHGSNSDKLELQVTPNELVQELHQILMDREETCHRTCFSLQLHGSVLDHFAELKNIRGLQDGTLIKVVEDGYTLREVRIHVRHIRDILNSLDLTDAFNGVDGASLTYVNIFTGTEISPESGDKHSSSKTTSSIYDPVDETLLPHDYLIPKFTKDLPLAPLHPVSKKEKPIKCVKSISFNHWNPPPGPLKMKGDLAYLSIATLEDKEFQVTACTKGFFVNQSTSGAFNPRPSPESSTFHSLVDLLNKISPNFKRNFSNLLKKRSSQHSLEKVPTPYQIYPWILPYLEHKEDALRAEDAFACRLGYEEHIPGQTRDWNEELQGTRELSRSTLPERLLRERAIFKVNSDFVAAASKGCQAVVDGNIMPINPGEDSKTHMFIWNNIFFSLGFDIRDHYKDLGGDAAAYVAPANDLKGVEAFNDLDTEKLYALGTVIMDYRGLRITGQSIIPGILEREQDQLVVYGSIDPSPPTDSPNNRIIIGNEEYAEILKSPCSKLRLAPHRIASRCCVTNNDRVGDVNHVKDPLKSTSSPVPNDPSPTTWVQLQTSYECKGIVGNDRRHYLLDLLRTYPPDLNFLPVEEGVKLSKESRKMGFPRSHRHKLCCLRAELVEAFVEHILLVKNIECSHRRPTNTEYSSQNAITPALETTHEVLREAGVDSTSATIPNLQQENEVGTEEGACRIAPEVEKDDEMVGKNTSGRSSLSGETNLASSKDSAIDSLDVNATEDTDDEPNKDVQNEEQPTEESGVGGQYYNSPFSPRTMKFRSTFPLLSDEIRFNPDAFLDTLTHDPAEEEKLKREKDLLLDAADFILCVQIPELIGEWLDYVSVPVDGFTLKETLHSKGINMRYLGVIIDRLGPVQKLAYIRNIAMNEMISRSVKHVFKLIIQSLDLSHLSKATAHFLNCYLASLPNPSPNISSHDVAGKNGKKRNRKRKNFPPYSNNSNEWISLTPPSLWKMIVKDAKQIYGTNISEASLGDLITKNGLKKIQLLRQFCLKCGVQIVLREYGMDHRHRVAFLEDDILNMFPLIKHVSHKALDAHSFFLAGQTKIQQGCLREGFELISESLNLMTNVYGPLHTEIASCLRLLARICYILGDRTQALLFQHKATIMSERLFGIDHSNTVTDYINLALYYVANFRTQCALKLLYRARYLMVHLAGNDHPELTALDSNLGLVLYSNGMYEESMLYLNHALELSIRYFGETSLKTAVIHHLLAGVYSCRGDFRTAINKERQALAIYKESLGEAHEKTLESSACLKHLTQQAVAMQRCINTAIVKGAGANNFTSLHIQKPSLSAILDLMNLINGILFVQIKPSELEKFRELEKQLIMAMTSGITETSPHKNESLQCKGDDTHVTNNHAAVGLVNSIPRAMVDSKNIVPYIIMKSAIDKKSQSEERLNESLEKGSDNLLKSTEEEEIRESVNEIPCPNSILDYTRNHMAIDPSSSINT